MGLEGEYTDAETGFVYLRARYYDPATGQFLSRDPLTAMTGAPYSYVDNNPLNGTDPLGLFCVGSLCTPKSIGNTLGSAWDATGGKVATAVYNNAGNLSTAASFLSAGAYAFCAVSAGVGCGLGLALSATSTALSGVNAYRACLDGGGNCTGALVSLGFSLGATGAGVALQRRAAAGLSNVFLEYARDTYLWRQAGVIGALTNGLSGIVGLLSPLFDRGRSSEQAWCPI